MLNQGQGTYPQLAGSFYNSAQMTPHDNGRNAHQVPTFFGGLQNMMSASTAMQNYQGMPLNQNILQTQSAGYRQYGTGLANTVGHIGTGMGIASGLGGLATMAGMGGGIIAGIASAPFMLAGAAVMGATSAYNRRIGAVEDIRNALQGSRLGYGLADPVTGTIGNQAALTLSRQMEHSALGAGLQTSDLKKVMGQASGLGMLNGMQSIGEVTKRVTDLAKASREIVMLGEGISMSDAMQLQKLTQDMGIGTTKFRGMNIGKNLVMAARASSMSMDQAAQLGGMGAMTFQQAGLGAASGMNAAFFTNIAAKGLTGVGAFSQRQLAALGGEQGVAQHLLSGQASTMARMSDTLVMGAVKLGQDGQFRIDRDMLDRYVRGDVTAEQMRERAKNIGRGMTKGQRARLLEGLQYSMPELKEQMSDMLSSEEIMVIQGREIQALRNRNPGLSMRRAAQAYFGDQAQAESFLGYAQNFQASRAEAERQRRIADQEQTLKYAGMAKSSSGLASLGRGVAAVGTGLLDAGYAMVSPFGEGMADAVLRMQDARERGMRRILGIPEYGRQDIGNLANEVFIRGSGGRTSARSILRGNYRSRNRMVAGVYDNLEDMIESHFASGNEQMLFDRLGISDGLNEIFGEGLEDRLRDYEEGERFFLRDINFGIDNFSAEHRKDRLLKAARVAFDAQNMGRVISGRGFRAGSRDHQRAYDAALDLIRKRSIQAAKGGGTGFFGGVDSSVVGYSALKQELAPKGFDDEVLDAALGEAYRYAKSAGGDLSKGFNLMLDRTAKAGSLELMTKPIAGELDTLDFKGGQIYAKGLSRALAESQIDAGDVKEVIMAFTNRRKEIQGEGAGRDSLAGILRLAGISIGKYRGRTKGLMGVIDSLRGARVRTTDKDDKQVEQTLEEAANTGVISRDQIARLVNADTINKTVEQDILERQKALDSELELALGEGGGQLRKDLVSTISPDDPEAEAYKEFVRPAANLAVTDSAIQARLDKQIEDQERRKSNTEVALESTRARLQELEKHRTAIRTGGEYSHTSRGRPYTTSYAGTSREHKNMLMTRLNEEAATLLERRNKQEKELKSITRDADTKIQDLREAKGTPGSEQYKAAQAELLAEATEVLTGKMTDERKRAAIKQYREGHTTLLTSSGTLQERLMALAEGDEKKREAYTRLMESSAGAELEQKFKAMRADAAMADPSKLQGLELDATQMIIEAAAKQKIALPGQEESVALPKVLGEIAGGIKDFRSAMQHIATITAGKSVKIMGPVTAEAEDGR